MIPRVRTDGYARGEHLTQEGPFVLDTRFHDIPITVARFIEALPDNCVAVSLRDLGGPAMRGMAESVAWWRGIKILWVRAVNRAEEV